MSSLLDDWNQRRSIKDVVFDLDGTLVDSLAGIAASVRQAITQVLPDREVPDLRALIGPPIAVMLARFWPDLDQETLNRAVAAFRQHYDETGCLLSTAYPGMQEAVSLIARADLRLFVLTNKPSLPAQRILAHLGVADFFTAIHGPDSIEIAFRSKPEGARRLAERYDLAPESTIIVGDGEDDAQAAQERGFGFLAARYGYGFPRLRQAQAKMALDGIDGFEDFNFLSFPTAQASGAYHSLPL